VCLYPGLLFADKSPMTSLAAKPHRSALFDRPAFTKWPERRYFQLCLAVSAMFFLICSVFSVGSYQGDEYFQIVEFASSKLSLTNAADLTWEYHAGMRPWLQPAIYAGVARVAALVGIHRPLTWLFLFRLVTAIAAWGSLWSLVTAGRRWVDGESERRRLYAVAALLWLLPYLGARTSAETMSTAALCFGIGLLEWRFNLPESRSRFWLAMLGGLAFGLCFEFRYASGVLPAGASLWYLWQSKGRSVALCRAHIRRVARARGRRGRGLVGLRSHHVSRLLVRLPELCSGPSQRLWHHSVLRLSLLAAHGRGHHGAAGLRPACRDHHGVADASTQRPDLGERSLCRVVEHCAA
jgi:hypothetical protein